MQHANELINAILKKATEPYSDWKIGITSTGRCNTEGRAACRFINYSKKDVQEAFDYFVETGMLPIHKIGIDVVNLYIFNTTSEVLSHIDLVTYNEQGHEM